MKADLFEGRAGHDHSDGVTSSAAAIEQAYRRGVQHGAVAMQECSPTKAGEWLDAIYRWRFEESLDRETPMPGAR